MGEGKQVLDCCTEIERFLDVNTQQLSENKYLCPLSGKKFKAAEFVRKHIFNKHGDKIEDVRFEVCSRGEESLHHNIFCTCRLNSSTTI